MPQTKLKDGSIMVCGNAVRDAEFKTVGTKNTPLCKIGLAIGKREDTTTIFVNVVAWRGLADLLAMAQKGDSIAVWGRMTEPREYNGKTYQDLNADWLSIASASSCQASCNSERVSSSSVVPAEQQFTEIEDDGELPFNHGL